MGQGPIDLVCVRLNERLRPTAPAYVVNCLPLRGLMVLLNSAVRRLVLLEYVTNTQGGQVVHHLTLCDYFYA